MAEMPVLLQESMKAGQEWGVKLMPEVQAEIQKRLKAEGLDK